MVEGGRKGRGQDSYHAKAKRDRGVWCVENWLRDRGLKKDTTANVIPAQDTG